MALRVKLSLRAKLTLRVKFTLRGTLTLRAKSTLRARLALRGLGGRDRTRTGVGPVDLLRLGCQERHSLGRPVFMEGAFCVEGTV